MSDSRLNTLAIRGLFPCTRELAFLNVATYGPGPVPVMEAVRRSLEAWSGGTGEWQEWERTADEARRLFAQLIRTRPEQVTLLPSVSAGAAQVGACLPDPAGGRSKIVVGEGEFRSNFYPWWALRDRGFEVDVLPFPDGRPAVEELADRIDARTALVALSAVQSATGFRLPVEFVRRLCEERGARLFLDASQAAGALEFSPEGIDYLAVSGYKWLFAPRGTAFLHVALSRLGELRPIAPNWKSPQNPLENYYGLPFDLATDASRLDYPLAWHCWVGAAEGLRLVLDVGVRAIEAHGLALAEAFREGLTELGLSTLFPERECSHVVGLAVPDPRAVSRALQESGVVAAVRDRYLRVSFALFNNDDDVARALAALERALRP